MEVLLQHNGYFHVFHAVLLPWVTKMNVSMLMLFKHMLMNRQPSVYSHVTEQKHVKRSDDGIVVNESDVLDCGRLRLGLDPTKLGTKFRTAETDAVSSLTGFRPVDCHLRLRVDDALSSYREDDMDWSDAWHTHQSCSSSRHATLISHLFAGCEPAPEFLSQSNRRCPGPALHPD